MSKTEIFPICVVNNAIQPLLQNFPRKVCAFLGKYLGLPLHIQKPRKVDDVQPQTVNIPYQECVSNPIHRNLHQDQDFADLKVQS